MRRIPAYPAAWIAAICLWASFQTTTALAESDVADLRAIESAFVSLAQRVSPSVVAVECRYNSDRKPADPAKRALVGSGVIISPDGLILTNEHVVRFGDHVYVILNNGKRYEAEIQSVDSQNDLAMLKINVSGLTPAKLGSIEDVRAGQWAFAVGNPFGISKDGRLAISEGIISALGKTLKALEDDGRKYYGNLIQTTADVNPGNSGGPLFNIQGEVIGLVTAFETKSGVSEGVGFAIPMSQRTRNIIETLSAAKPVEYGFLGVNIADADQRACKQVSEAYDWGVQITRVFPGSPAEMAELLEKDLIVEFDSVPVRNIDHFVQLVAATPAGSDVPILLYRDQQRQTVHVQLGRRNTLLADVRKPD